jgi:hypothetical protein
MNFRQPVVYIIVIVAVVLALMWTFWFRKKDTTSTQSTNTTTQTNSTAKISNLTNANPADFDTITKSTYSSANQKALEQDSDNKIAAVEVDLDANLDANTVITRYIFNSTNEASYNFVITFSKSGDKYIRALIPTDDYLGVLTAMNTKAWKYNYVTALQLAEKNGGLAWREKNTLSSVTLTLKHAGSKNWLLWVVEYDNTSGNNLTIMLDANSGQVVAS